MQPTTAALNREGDCEKDTRTEWRSIQRQVCGATPNRDLSSQPHALGNRLTCGVIDTARAEGSSRRHLAATRPPKRKHRGGDLLIPAIRVS